MREEGEKETGRLRERIERGEREIERERERERKREEREIEG